MWKVLYERYSAKTTFSSATVLTTLIQMKYTGQLMHEYVTKWESCAAQLVPLDTPVAEEVLMTMNTEFFADRSKSLYGMDLSTFALQRGPDLAAGYVAIATGV